MQLGAHRSNRASSFKIPKKKCASRRAGESVDAGRNESERVGGNWSAIKICVSFCQRNPLDANMLEAEAKTLVPFILRSPSGGAHPEVCDATPESWNY